MRIQQLKIYIYFAILFLSSFFGSIFLGSVCVISYILKPTWYRSLYDHAIGAWEWLAAALLEKFLSVEVIATGDVINEDDQSLILMNHRTCFDWMYFWSVLIRQTKVRREKIVLKSSLKSAPGAGWAMQGASFLFLDRKWEHDEAYLDVILNYFKSLYYKSHILIFPEGTDLNEKTSRRSKLYAEENNLPVYNYVLHPRTTGFVHITDTLQKAWNNVAIYDVTISFDSTPPQNEREIIKGILPKKVYFHIKKYNSSELPQSKEDLAKWCKQLWVKKEAYLKDLYERGDRPPNTRRDSVSFRLLLYVTILLWLLFIIFSFYACYCSTYVQIFVVFSCCAYILFTKLGGLEFLTANCKTHIFY